MSEPAVNPNELPRGNRCLTLKEVARYLRVSVGRVKGWIDSGELQAFDRRDPRCFRSALAITPDALARFIARREAMRAPAPQPKKRQKLWTTDFCA